MSQNEYSDGFDFSLIELSECTIEDLKDYAKSIRPRYRDKWHLEAAYRENSKILDVYYEAVGNNGVGRKDIAPLEYEQGYVEYLRGRFDTSIESFDKSAKNAHIDNDTFGELVGEFNSIQSQFFGKILSPQATHIAMVKILNNLSEYKQQGIDVDKCNRWIFNMQGRVFDLVVEMGDLEEAEIRFNQVLNSRLVQNDLYGDSPSPAILIFNCSYLSRLSFLKGDFDEALQHFSKYVDFDLSEWGEKDAILVNESVDLEAISREYYYLGKTLRAKGLNKQAHEVFKAALALEPNRGNHFFQDKIREEMS